MEPIMKQALIFCLAMTLLFLIGLVAGQRVFKHHRYKLEKATQVHENVSTMPQLVEVP